MKVPSKLKIARVIGRMPFFQVHFTQKQILQMLNNNVISQKIIDKAIRIIKKESKKGNKR